MPPDPQPQDPREETSKPAVPPATPPVAPPAPPVPPPPPATPAPTPPGQVDPSRKGVAEVDIDKILLPQKEVRKVESERRVSAGVLLDQEIKAGTEGLPKPAPAPKAPPAGAAAAKPPAEESEVQPLETYQGAIEKVMKGQDVSVVSIAAAEAQRRAQRGSAVSTGPTVSTQEKILSFVKKFSMVITGVALIAVAGGVLAYLLLRPTTVPVAVAPTAPFIAVDDTQSVVVAPGDPARNLVVKLDAAKKTVALSLGLIERLIPSVSSTTDSGEVLTAMNAQDFLSTVAPQIPPNLLRTIEPTFLLGVHVYDANQPFLMFRVDSYQEAFSGMLDWEYRMRGDLLPLFDYTPREHIPEENIPVLATTTASTTDAITPLPQVQTPFVDKIVENHDARVLQNNTGDVYFLWTFIDRNTLVITTNAATLREILSRLQNAPVTAVPGQ